MKPAQTHSVSYEIRVAGHLPPQWADWFEGLTITLEEDNTLLTGPMLDQAALHGVLKKVRDLGLSLVSVSAVQPKTPAAPETHEAGQSDVHQQGDCHEHY